LAGIVGSVVNRHNVPPIFNAILDTTLLGRRRTMLSRRKLLTGTMGAGLALTTGHPQLAAAQPSAGDLER
jgi:hypothetical protein